MMRCPAAMFAAHMLLVLSGIANWHAAQAREWPEKDYDGEGSEHWDKDGDEHFETDQLEKKNHSGSHKSKYGNWTCVCDFNETSDATNHSTWKNWTAVKRCKCGSVPGHWEFIGEHGRDNEHWDEDDKKEHNNSHRKRWGEGDEKDEDDEKKYKSSHRGKKDSKQWEKDDTAKDVDIGVVLGFFACGILAGGIMVTVICLVCQRKRKAPPAVGTCVLGRPTTDDPVVGDVHC